MEDLNKHFGPWSNEKCWNIDSNKLSSITCTENSNSISIDSNMSYKNYELITQGHRHQDINVHGATYCYENGDCTFISDNMDSVEKWVNNYEDIIQF